MKTRIGLIVIFTIATVARSIHKFKQIGPCSPELEYQLNPKRK